MTPMDEFQSKTWQIVAVAVTLVSFSGNLVNPCLCREISMLIFSKVFFGGDELSCGIWDTMRPGLKFWDAKF